MQRPIDPDRILSHLSDQEEDEVRDRGSNYLERHLIESRTLLLAGPVTDRMARDCSARVMVMERRDPDAPITVMINSPGGSADSGFAIYDLLQFVRPPVFTVVNGLCASAGILIGLATDSDKRFALPESRFMIHQPSTMGRGTASDLDITAKEIIKLRDRYNRIISTATGKAMEEVEEHAKRDFWLSASEAQEYGLITKVISGRDELPGV